MSDAIDRALFENHALIAAILEHHSSGRHVPAVALLERLQLNLEFIAALSEHGLPNPSSSPNPQNLQPTDAPRPSSAPARIAPALPVPAATPPVGTMYWSEEEHARFEEGMRRYGNARDGKPNFKAIASHVGTRTPVQVRSHLQKVQKKARRGAEDNQGNQISQIVNQEGQTGNQAAQSIQPQHQVQSHGNQMHNLSPANIPAGNLPTGNRSTGNLPTGNLSAGNQAQGSS